MTKNYTIVKIVEKPFVGGDGKEIKYFWYKAIDEDGVQVEFGSQDGGREEGKTYPINVIKYQSTSGIRFKEQIN